MTCLLVLIYASTKYYQNVLIQKKLWSAQEIHSGEITWNKMSSFLHATLLLDRIYVPTKYQIISNSTGVMACTRFWFHRRLVHKANCPPYMYMQYFYLTWYMYLPNTKLEQSPTNLNKPIVEKGCIYNFSFYFCGCVWSMGAIFQNLSPSVTLKMESRSPKSNRFLSLSQQNSCTSLVKIHPFLHEIGCRQAIFNNLSPCVTLKTGSVIKI